MSARTMDVVEVAALVITVAGVVALSFLGGLA